jgi:teichuronic acid biosynthesis protein TuaE
MSLYKLSERQKYLLFYLCVLTAFIGPGIQYNKFYAFHLIFIVGISAIIFRIIKDWSKSTFPIVLLIYCGASLFWSVESSYGLKLFIILVLGTLLTIFIIQWDLVKKKKLEVLLSCLKIIFCIQIGIGLLEIFSTFRYPISKLSSINHWFGINHLQNDLITGAQSKVLATGLSWNTNQYSLFLTIFLPFIFLLRNSILKYSILIISSYIIIHNSSRACIIALLFEAGLVFILYLKFNKMKKSIKITLITSSAAIASFIVYTKLVVKFDEFAANFNILGYSLPSPVTVLPAARTWLTNDEIRISMIMNCFNSFLENPLFGAGLGASGSPHIQKLYSTSDIIRSIHFFWLELLTDLGLFGFLPVVIIFLLILVKIYKKLSTTNDKSEREFGICFFIAIFTFCLSCIAISSAYYYLPMYILLGFSIVYLSDETVDA